MDSSHFLEKELPLNSSTLNTRLATQYIDVPETDDSFQANLTRIIADLVGRCFKPKMMLGILRVLKAITLCFLVLTICASIMYIIFIKILAGEDVRAIAGGTRDTVIRLYGLGLSFIAIGIEIDVTSVVKRFSGLKGFIPRSLLMFLIAMITGTNSMINNDSTGKSQQSYNNANSGYASNDDANNAYANNDDANNAYANNDDAANNNYASGYGNANNYANDDATSIDLSTEYPSSAVNFQMVVSLVL
jgi:hypothetical protein